MTLLERQQHVRIQDLEQQVRDLQRANNREIHRRRGAEYIAGFRFPDTDDARTVAAAHAMKRVWDQLVACTEEHPPFASAHEAWGVIDEEWIELKDEIRKQEAVRSRPAIVCEAIDLAVPAIRLAAELGA